MGISTHNLKYLILYSVFAVILLSACGEKSAQKSLIGTWEIARYYIELKIPCTKGYETFSDSLGNLGTAVYTQDEFEINFNINFDDSLCQIDSLMNYSGAWLIKEKRQKFPGVFYKITMDSVDWDLVFSNGESGYKRPGNKEEVFLENRFPNTEYVFLKLRRVE
ncbi:hypothetical protein OAA53_02905 [Salibacteraceae bacterium]|nr:hypothetical protein [Salibacteraceae bacterium]